MILSEIRSYLKERGQATLADIALHFKTEPDALRGMLEVWIKKGKVQKQSATASCGSSCQQCEPSATEIYAWVESDVRVSAPVPGHCEHN
jgi:putative ferrous iron transport protein C